MPPINLLHYRPVGNWITATCTLTSIVLVYRSYKINISNMIYPPNDLATQLATGEHEQETEEEMLERVQREEDSFEDFSSATEYD
jgi:hypothetical protein